ncbi:TM1266 family iron-only hydrogenase system putative regulator [Dethiobacter alkaliphilus]|uniref:TM1266 family iron-only hydrogenase system putative regulator n=1 Tax=Dethiobacter alkaliphilus TaxID=427926 RepID=UPI002226A5E9|nr:TM1266 family iron-only hydrogenase system putative regulator [Dethiobacter alkaliphilus]MCW3490148.1 iron-only hydrogenase system regulator [Dethiobacter alkaliphilus]
MDKRIGVIGIVIEDRENAVRRVNAVLSEYAHVVVGRMGIPYRERQVAVISLIVDGTTDEIGAMTGKLGAIDDVAVKSALTKK